jgi:hypothetical protein
VFIDLPWSAGRLLCGVINLAVVLAGAGGSGEGEFSVSAQGAADAFVGPDDGQDQNDGLIQRTAPGVTVGVGGAGGAAMVGAGGAELCR